MVEAGTDPELVTATIRRETAQERRRKEEEAQLALTVEPVPNAVPGALAVETQPVVEVPVDVPPADPDAGFRHMRIGVCVVLVVALTVLWIWQRRPVKG